MRSLLVALPSLALACSTTPVARNATPPGQSFPQAVTMICEVDSLAGIAAESDPLGVGSKRSAWLADHVENPDAIELKTLMSVKGAAEQAKMLRAHLEECGVKRCALADVLEKGDAGGLAP
jgi:hypothetical protein